MFVQIKKCSAAASKMTEGEREKDTSTWSSLFEHGRERRENPRERALLSAVQRNKTHSSLCHGECVFPAEERQITLSRVLTSTSV